MKLRRGEKVGSIDLPPDEELEGVGESFKAISEKLASRSLGRLMAGVTHEVRNPLNAMTIHLELVREHLLPAAEQLARARSAPCSASKAADDTTPEVEGAREHIDVIASEIKRLDEVITGFVRFIRPEELQLQPVNVQVARQRSHRARRARRAAQRRRLPGRCAGRLPELRADPALLRQALLNLALNGCQAMPNGGKLTMGGENGQGSPHCADGRRYRRRDFGRQARPDLRPVLHDQAGRQRHRSLDRVQNRPAARRRDRGAVD